MKNQMIALMALAMLAGCNRSPAVGGAAGEASAQTQAANAAFAKALPLDDPQDFDDAKHGLIAKAGGKITAADGTVLADLDALSFVSGPAPATVNPSLWRHAQLNGQIGLFEVTPGIHQLRGFDISNMTLIDGQSGWIVVDPLTSTESASKAIAFAREHLGNKAISAVIFTHSHIDHFGGVLGVLPAKEAVDRNVPVVAPEGFIEEATSENVLVGIAMGRRSIYQFGKNLERSPTGFVDAGLGRALVYGSFGILKPTQLVTQPTQEMTLDGVKFVFHNVPNTEAPAELSFEVPAMKAYCGAEILAQTMHNLLPVRGAKVRNSLEWSKYLDDALGRLDGIDVYFASHNWPLWGHDRIARFITAHRDVYRYTHDQTVRMMNSGMTASEIAAAIKLPKALDQQFGVRGYYGDIRHNAKAVYQFYLGNYDGNPAHLDPLPPEEMGARWLQLLGGADKAVAAAQQAYDAGDYRWAAELLNQVMFTEPGNTAAAQLQARTYDQLGYMAEASTWRNSYLTAADEIRKGPPAKSISRASMIEVMALTPIERFLDAMAAALNGPKAEGVNLKINLVLTDKNESHVLWIENSVLHHRKAPPAVDANATLALTQGFFVKMMAGTAGGVDLLTSDEVKVTGSKLDLAKFFGLLDQAQATFAVVTK